MNKDNSKIMFKGSALKVKGKCLKEGDKAPAFTLTGNDLGDVSLDNYKGQAVIISVVPSLDTPTCDIQTRKFNDIANQVKGKATILTVSMDLPFAQKRWCLAKECENVIALSDYKHRSFGEAYGVLIESLGLLARSIFVLDKDHKVTHVEYVAELSEEPNYDAILKAV